jgi:hypothetical protein
MSILGLGRHSDALSLSFTRRLESLPTVENRIRQYVEQAVEKCGSAAALARQLHVKPPTVSQWRAGLKKPDAVNLIRVQDIARTN